MNIVSMHNFMQYIVNFMYIFSLAIPLFLLYIGCNRCPQHGAPQIVSVQYLHRYEHPAIKIALRWGWLPVRDKFFTVYAVNA